MTGLLSRAGKDTSTSPLAVIHGFWGVDDGGDNTSKMHAGIRRGAAGEEPTPEEARTAPGNLVFVSGDRVGLLVDMDARTLTVLGLRGRLWC